MKSKVLFFVAVLFFVGVLLSGAVSGHPDSVKCPVLPSGRCWVHCNVQIHQIICEDGNWQSIYDDLLHYADKIEPKGAKIQLDIWNSDELTNIDARLLSPVLPVLQASAV